MKWMTLWKRKRSSVNIAPGDQVICLGSCFAEHVAQFLRDNKCSVTLNPAGILYNPVSISRNAHTWLQGKPTDSRIIKWDEIHHSLDHHGSVSSINEKDLKDNIRQGDEKAKAAMTASRVAIVTFGSAWVYRWKEDGEIVANCHKILPEKFEKAILDKKAIVDKWKHLLSSWKDKNPDLNVIFSVSPVRHIRDGIIENQRSKSTLILAIAELVEMFDFAEYFPSYEILVDELRDYRFYTDDLVHPNSMAVDYVLNTFSACYFSQDMENMKRELSALKKAMDHKPFFPQTNSYHDHLRNTQIKLNALSSEYPDLDWMKEENKLAALWDQATRST